MADASSDISAQEVRQVDPVTGVTQNVETIGGKGRALVDANISSVNVPLGQDPLPDCYFTISIAGGIGDTIRVQIAGTSADSTSPDSDLPAVDVTSTITATEAGVERLVAELIADDLNADTNFQNAFLEAEAINDDNRPIVHITSTKFSLSGEFYERPLAGDVAITTTGTTAVLIDSDHEKLISRAKTTSLGRDPQNPHRLGVQAISGTVRVRASEVENLLKEYLMDGGSNSMAVDGSGVPVSFTINSNPDGGQDKVIEILKFICTDTNIKVQDSKFLGLNTALANGILVQFYKNGVLTYSEPLIKNTPDILGQWANTQTQRDIIGQSGGDYLESSFNLVEQNLQFILEAGSNDYIECLIQDDLTSLDSLRLLATGFLED